MVLKGLQIGLPVQFQLKDLYGIIHFIKGHHTPKRMTYNFCNRRKLFTILNLPVNCL